MKRSATKPTMQASIMSKADINSLPVKLMRPLLIAGAVPPKIDVDKL